MQALSSFFPLKEHASALRRSWEGDNCRDGGSCRWAMSRTTSAPCMRARVSNDTAICCCGACFLGLAALVALSSRHSVVVAATGLGTSCSESRL